MNFLNKNISDIKLLSYRISTLDNGCGAHSTGNITGYNLEIDEDEIVIKSRKSNILVYVDYENDSDIKKFNFLHDGGNKITISFKTNSYKADIEIEGIRWMELHKLKRGVNIYGEMPSE